MGVRQRFRPSPALIVALIALLVSLAGTSVAAVSVALPPNSVGRAQLKDNAVTSKEVLNRSLKAVDFGFGQLPKGPKGDKGDPGVAAPGYVAQVVSQTSTSHASTTAQTFQDLAGASQGVVVPTGETAKVYVWFSAESACYGGAGNGYCSVRIIVDGNGLAPVSGDDFAFDSTDAGDEGTASWEGHSMVRVSDELGAGTHTVKVQMRTSQGTTTLRLDDWALVIERIKL